MFQVDAEICPHYDDLTGCLIYDERPAVCKVYPFEPTLNKYIIHESCPEVKRLKKNGYIINLPECYKPALFKLYNNYVQNLKNIYFIEKFDLESRIWRKIIC
jgi:hypothetical protein